MTRSSVIAGHSCAVTQALSRGLAARGNHVAILVAGNGQRAQDPSGPAVEFLSCDVADRSNIQAAIIDIETRLGPVEHLIFSAEPAEHVAHSDGAGNSNLAATIIGPLRFALQLCQATVPRLAARREGSLLFLLSDYTTTGFPKLPFFAASHAALYGFAKSIAREFGPSGIRVNCLALQRNGSEKAATFCSERPEELAATAEFLLCDRASYITGQLLGPNGSGG